MKTTNLSISIACLILLLTACSHGRLFGPTPADLERCAYVQDNEMDDYLYINIDTNKCFPFFESNREALGFPRIILNKKTKKLTYQIYIVGQGPNWHFLYSYRYLYKDRLEEPRALYELAREAVTGGIREEYTFDLPEKRFQFFSNNDMKIRLYGQR